MGRIVAIDYGTKKVGLAVTDDQQLFAFGLATVHSTEVIKYLKDYNRKYAIDSFVIGEPKQLSNSATHSTQAVKNFVIHLGREFPGIQTECIDERYTSKIAQRSMIESGLSKKKRSDKKLIDEISATIILQDYLIQKENGFR
ncbi:MAG: Holliday junction resolvase RuvX [Flavobacteriales bacterium]|nr:Holliday junction resolvase RuvX [Flavobacteriales bacterium]